jgi:hypothetical protein
MQTFLPFADFADSSAVLDNRRLGKQRVETFQILRALTWPGYAWKNHPAVRMWRGFVPALVAYGLANCAEWVARGCADSVRPSLLAFTGDREPDVAELARRGELPPWLGADALHLSHRSALLRKDPTWYGPVFGDIPDDLPYWWPEDLFPRWPIRPAHPCTAAEALRLLGFDDGWPGQVEPASAAVDGRDCLAVFRPGTGGRSAGLFAGLRVGGTTLRILPATGTSDRFAVADSLPERPVVPERCPVPAELTARQPTPEDLAAMAAELQPSPWRFAHPDRIDAVARPDLIVVERADALEADARRRIGKARHGLGSPPLLVLTGRADAAERARLADDFDLRDPVHTGGGWDLSAFLDVTRVDPRRIAAAVAVSRRPSLVVAADRTHVDRLVGSLVRAGLRAMPVAPGMRPSRVAQASASWRRRASDALVVTPEVDLTLLGRVVPAHLVSWHLPDEPADWREVAERSGAPAVSVLITPDAPAWAQDWAATDGCLRAWLLDHFGEPAPTACGRCSREIRSSAAPARVR